MDEFLIQREYYKETAHKYEKMHVVGKGPHDIALSFLMGLIDYYTIHSVLDVGAGTGRIIKEILKKKPNIKICGIEPSKHLRNVALANGIPDELLLDGDGTNLNFNEGTFDLVCAFGVLHHVKNPAKMVKEMIRVAKKAVFISDANNLGQGKLPVRIAKQIFKLLRLWPLMNFIKTKGKGYTISAGDGLAYSYSVFNDYHLLKKSCDTIHIMNTSGTAINMYRQAGHMALFAVKK